MIHQVKFKQKEHDSRIKGKKTYINETRMIKTNTHMCDEIAKFTMITNQTSWKCELQKLNRRGWRCQSIIHLFPEIQFIKKSM